MSVQSNQTGVVDEERQPQQQGAQQPIGEHPGPEPEQQHAPEITPPPKLPPAKPRTALMLVGVVLLVLVVAGVLTLLSRMHSRQVLANETERESIPTVAVTHPKPQPADEELVLPGTLQAYEESPIYARTNGYLLKWFKDIGSPVKKGELLALIDTPEVDQELLQARATRQQILAQMDLQRSMQNATAACAKPIRFRKRKLTSRPADISRLQLTWPQPMPTYVGWKSWSRSSGCMRRLMEC